jgi:hypothetical protein
MDAVLALRALAAIIGDEVLRERFLALTGCDAPTLRANAGRPEMAVAVRDFLCGHEPDLLRVAAMLDVPPAALCGHR